MFSSAICFKVIIYLFGAHSYILSNKPISIDLSSLNVFSSLLLQLSQIMERINILSKIVNTFKFSVLITLNAIFF